jgi:hypothetical protein
MTFGQVFPPLLQPITFLHKKPMLEAETSHQQRLQASTSTQESRSETALQILNFFDN